MSSMTGRESRKSKKNVQRKANKLKKFVDSFVCCITANQNSEEEEEKTSTIVEEVQEIDQNCAPNDTCTLKSGIEEVGKVDENSPGHQKQKCNLNGKDGQDINSVPVLQWSRFSCVYRHGLPVMLGEGDQGYVTLMKDSVTNKLVAVKTWHKDPDTDVIMMTKMFKSELNAMMKFNGEKYFPAVIGILPNPDSAVSFSLVQEFVGDEKTKASLSLAEYLQGEGKRFTHQELISISLEVTEALKTIHEEGWVHCDLKADNVMLQVTEEVPSKQYTREGGFWIHETPKVSLDEKGSVHAKIIDFGLAGPITEANMPMAYPKEMKKFIYELCPQIAPEVVKGLGKVPYSYESDIYSLGVLLQEVSDSGVKVLRKLSESCMAKKPRKRPSISEVILRLNDIQSS